MNHAGCRPEMTFRRGTIGDAPHRRKRRRRAVCGTQGGWRDGRAGRQRAPRRGHREAPRRSSRIFGPGPAGAGEHAGAGGCASAELAPAHGSVPRSRLRRLPGVPLRDELVDTPAAARVVPARRARRQPPRGRGGRRGAERTQGISSPRLTRLTGARGRRGSRPPRRARGGDRPGARRRGRRARPGSASDRSPRAGARACAP